MLSANAFDVGVKFCILESEIELVGSHIFFITYVLLKNIIKINGK